MSDNATKTAQTIHRNEGKGAGKGHNAPPVDVTKLIDDAMKLHTQSGKTTCSLAVWLINSIEFSYVQIEAYDTASGSDRTEKYNALLMVHSKHVKESVDRLQIIANEMKALANKAGEGHTVHNLRVEKAEIDGRLKSARNILGTAMRVARMLRRNGARSAEMVGKLNQLKVTDKDGDSKTDSLNSWLKEANKAFATKPDTSEQTKSTGDTAAAAAAEPTSLIGKALRNATTAVDTLAATKDKDGKPVPPAPDVMAEVDTLVAHLMQLIGPKALEQKIEALKIKLRREANAKTATPPAPEEKKA